MNKAYRCALKHRRCQIKSAAVSSRKYGDFTELLNVLSTPEVYVPVTVVIAYTCGFQHAKRRATKKEISEIEKYDGKPFRDLAMKDARLKGDAGEQSLSKLLHENLESGSYELKKPLKSDSANYNSAILDAVIQVRRPKSKNPVHFIVEVKNSNHNLGAEGSLEELQRSTRVKFLKPAMSITASKNYPKIFRQYLDRTIENPSKIPEVSDFVLLYVPFDHIWGAVDTNLLKLARKDKILICTPSTLLYVIDYAATVNELIAGETTLEKGRKMQEIRRNLKEMQHELKLVVDKRDAIEKAMKNN